MWTGVGIQMGTGGALLLIMLVCTAQGSSPSGRSDDPQPLEVVVQNLSSQLATVQARLAALEGNMHQLEAKENQRVAFTASIVETSVKAASGHIIPFSRVITNVGSSYDAITSAFIVPYDGQYMIFVSVDTSSNYKRLDITKNGHAIIPGHNDVLDHHIYAGGVLTLLKGDEVTISHGLDVDGFVDGGPEAIFSGFKI